MAGRGVSTVSTIMQKLCQLLVEYLWNETISKNMPKCQTDLEKKIVDMEELWQFPCSWAVLNGCHIPMKCPTPGGLQAFNEYHNYKNFYSIVLMALVDANYQFVWGSCGFPGNSHDAIISQSTNLWNSIQEGMLPSMHKHVDKLEILPLILADSAFPLRNWLMKPYSNAVLSHIQKFFNYRLSRARMVTEYAFGQLGRWRVLLRKNEGNMDHVRISVFACMVLHSICIMRGDTISKKLNLTFNHDNNKRRDREEVRKLLQMRKCQKTTDVSKEAKKIRNALSDKLWTEKETGKVC
ncbi:protein ALP1-like [Xenia sp. Carnegie-2017]|uniref:protein ALP1-like n=1 Tax=Xenia sp. Carnegie-2017 TaxID=2897299 RepID=UPI001F033FE3|nr:protein ALP1-like [Xenia sp. Carnegie-2017]